MRHFRIPEQMLVYTLALIFFLCTLAENFSGPHDSIGYLNGIVTGKHLFHPHHILYHFITHYWLVFARSIAGGIPDYYLVEAFTALWGSGIITVVYTFFRKRFGLTVPIAALGASIIAFSYGLWFYSVNIEVYAPPMFFLLLCLYILTKKDFRQRDVVSVALLHVMALLFHQVHILFTPVVLYTIWRERRKIHFFRSAVQYGLIGVMLTGTVYFVVGWIIEEQSSWEQWVNWMKGYARYGSYWHPLSTKTPFLVFTGFTHAFVGGHFIFQLPLASDYFNHSMMVHSLHDEMYLSRHISPTMAVCLLVLTAGVALLLLLLLIRFIRKYRSIRQQWPAVINPLLIAGAVYTAFFCFWMPEILEFWIFQMVLVWVLLIGTLPVTGFPFRLKPVLGLGFISISLLVVNYFGSMRWMQNLENDWYYTKVKPVQPVATPNDLILVQQGWIFKDFLDYFTKAPSVEVPWTDSVRISVDRAINQTLQHGGKLYIYPEANNVNEMPDTRYIDSILTVHGARTKVLQPAEPRILIVQ